MVTVGKVYSDPEIFKLQQEFTALFGGRVMGGVPDGRLYYTPENGNASRLSPYEETIETVVQIMRDSIACGKNLIMEQWPVWEDIPGRIY